MPPAQIPKIDNSFQFGPKRVTGAYVWGIRFTLPRRAARDGFIIQEIHAREDGTNSAGQRVEGFAHYWEAWPIAKGDRTITVASGRQTLAQFLASQGLSAPAGADFHTAVNDIFFRSFPLGNVGWKVVRAVAGFYHEALPADFTANNAATGAGPLLSTIVPPPFWQNFGLSRVLWFEFDYSTSRAAASAQLQTSVDEPGVLMPGTNPPNMRTH
jgi:hypothetical protein